MSIYQPNATFSTTLTNDPTLTKRCLLLQNKDKVATSFEQYLDCLKDWCEILRSTILTSGNIKESDLTEEFKPCRITFTMSAKGDLAIMLFQGEEKITDPNLCETLFTWINQAQKHLKGESK